MSDDKMSNLVEQLRYPIHHAPLDDYQSAYAECRHLMQLGADAIERLQLEVRNLYAITHERNQRLDMAAELMRKRSEEIERLVAELEEAKRRGGVP